MEGYLLVTVLDHEIITKIFESYQDAVNRRDKEILDAWANGHKNWDWKIYML